MKVFFFFQKRATSFLVEKGVLKVRTPVVKIIF